MAIQVNKYHSYTILFVKPTQVFKNFLQFFLPSSKSA